MRRAASDRFRAALFAAFQAAVQAAHPSQAIRDVALPECSGRTVILSTGKAAISMAQEVRNRLGGPVSGVVIARQEELPATVQDLRVMAGTHPEPGEASVRAGKAAFQAVQNLRPEDLLLCLISGGASSLMCAPQGVTLQQKAQLTRALLHCGASIHEINAVRKHLSRIKGGQLAAAAFPARVVSLIVSDVVGDDLSVIASGPTAPDPSTYADALAVLDRYGLQAPEAREHLSQGRRGDWPETPTYGDPAFARVENRVIASGPVALGAGAAALHLSGWEARIWRDDVTGDARQAAAEHAREARLLKPGAAILSGGETTTVVRAGAGRGGRNLEFLLALALEDPDVYALAADTDGIDGSSSAAGAVVTPDTLERAAALGLDPRAALEGSDAHSFFEALGDLVQTGPTGTNVNDFRCILRPALEGS
ncbi:glycerate kinase [Deinococcus deserti]|uniref:Putative hydroxypyruvate reductase n=1 Tax=Deinococcus deserti (strain DSM 17065 / CIP 109153 / LMG 22923 / VCD115) TaxID=546414 RepID=C1D2I5_DEIDV|nr:glycerate kinase [Deinococcus deserti]ACO47624.1 putative hydroxypyruvate reductase, precursor [Deinococcus deserti VCD115]